MNPQLLICFLLALSLYTSEVHGNRPAIAEPARRHNMVATKVSAFRFYPPHDAEQKRKLERKFTVIRGKVSRAYEYYLRTPSLSHEKNFADLQLNQSDLIPGKPRAGFVRIYFGHSSQSGLHVPKAGETFVIICDEFGRILTCYSSK